MGTRLFVGNLPFSATEQALRDLFGQDGRAVTDAKVVTDRESGRSRGFGFVEMATQKDADAAIRALNGQVFEGRPLTVNEAKERVGGR